MSIADQLRSAIERSGQTRLEIARKAGIAYDSLAKFVDQESDINLSTADALCRHLGLELAEPKRRAKS